MPVTTSSAFTTEPGETALTLTYPSGSAGDTLLVWLSVSDALPVTISGDLDVGELLDTINSSGRLRVYKRVRQSGDTDATWTVLSDTRMIAIAANLTPDMDDTDPTTAFVGNSFASVSPPSVPGGPGLLAVWWSFSELDVSASPTVLEAPSPDSDLTTGFELRLYQITRGTNVAETPPTNPSFSLFVRATSYTTVRAVGGWRNGKAGSGGSW